MTRDEAIKYMIANPGQKTRPTDADCVECSYDPESKGFPLRCYNSGKTGTISFIWGRDEWEKTLFTPDVDLLDPEKCQPEGAYECAIENDDYPPMAMGACRDIPCENCLCGLLNRKQLIATIEKLGGQRKPGPEFVEFAVYDDEGIWRFLLLGDEYSLEEAAALVGFAGIKFEGLNFWAKYLSDFNDDGTPRTPRKVRFVKGEK